MCCHKILRFQVMELILFICLSSFCNSTDIISRGDVVKDGDLIISSGQKFVLGFFSPENSTSRYVGIWYHEIQTQTVVWVANRENPLSEKNGILKIQNDGNLVILDGQENVIWSTNAPKPLRNSIAVINDTGDLALMRRRRHHRNNSQIYWQSFDYPTDTYLPGMIAYLHDNHHVIRSWKSSSDPSPGLYSMGIEYRREKPQIIIWEGTKRRWRSGQWNGVSFIGVQHVRTAYSHGFKFIYDEAKPYFIYTISNTSNLTRFQLTYKGNEEKLIWKNDIKKWDLRLTEPAIQCDLYNTCGPFGICDMKNVPICSCLIGFKPKDYHQWKKGNWSGGCTRKTELQCNNISGRNDEMDVFYHVDDVKLPDFVDYVGVEGKEECEGKCLKNCSCVAFSIVTGLNCMMWFNDLNDIQKFDDGGNTLCLRIDQTEFGRSESGRYTKKIVLIAALVFGVLLSLTSIWLLYKCKIKLGITFDTTQTTKTKSTDANNITSRKYFEGFSSEGPGNDLAYFSFNSVALATNNFSHTNQLGHGGFGLVYKGRLPGGEEIAVKRLCKMSRQGEEEFKNEVTLIARLQHRNLVKLLGCCIEGEEKVLLYEYMPNKSLDTNLFDINKKTKLDWSKRSIIIEGVARGLLYLHRDSRLKIIHRDLKASNILLDEDMNPKISDFGMARIFEGNQNEASTTRVVGTYGYMSPEYAMEGLFSVKSDVYSFGVLILEIVSGQKNTSFSSADYSNIIGYAWNLWENGKAIELVDPSINADILNNHKKILKCIHIAMLCVQDTASHRPTMSDVMLMLESDNMDLPQPRQPTVTSKRRSRDYLGMWDENQEITPSNDVTITTIVGR